MRCERLIGLALLVGCTIPEEDFAATYAVTICDRLEECDKGSYENLYSDAEDCEDDWEDGAELFMSGADFLGADYSEEQARDCIDEIRTAECGAFSSGKYDCDIYE